MAGRRLRNKVHVREWLLENGAATSAKIVAGTGLARGTVKQALYDIRKDPSLEYVTVPVFHDGYVYGIAASVDDMKSGLRHEVLVMRTRAESLMIAGDKATALAVTAADFALAADLKATARLLYVQADALLAAVAA